MRETVQGVKRVGPRRSNGEGSLIVVGGGVEGAGTAVRWAGSRRLFAAAVLVSFSLVGLCDRLGGGHTVWVSWGGSVASRSPRFSRAPLPVRPLGRDLSLPHHREPTEQRSSSRVPPDPS